MPYYDEEGNQIEGVLSPDEAKDLQAKNEELSSSLKTKSDDYEKLSNKDHNFSGLRKKNAEDRESATSTWSETEKGLLGQIHALEEKMDAGHAATIGKANNTRMNEVAGDNDELKESLNKEYERLGGSKAMSKEEASEIFEEAVMLVSRRSEKVNPINAFTPGTGGGAPLRTGNKVNQNNVNSLAKSLGLKLD